jgi:hypothetical protein
MKISRLVALLAIIGMFGVSSCSKKSDDVTPDQNTTQNAAGFRVKIDGKDYAPDFAYALANNPGTTGYYAIYGLDSKTSDVVFVSLPNTSAEGTYPLSNVNIGAMSFNSETYSTVNGGSGTVTITRKTATNIIGTFSFTAFDATSTSKRALTEGTFNVPVR